MNLLEILSKEIDVRHLNNDEKIRYIYLRICEIFSFDCRYYYTGMFNDEKLRKDILNQKINIYNVDNYEVVCHAISKMFYEIIPELTGLDVYINGILHTYAVTKFNNKEYALDITECNDFARVKMNTETVGFHALEKNLPYEENSYIKEIDETLRYSFSITEDIFDSNMFDNPYEILINLRNILEYSKCRFYYGDAYFMLSHLYNVIDEISKTYIDKEYNFHRLITLDNEYFVLEKYGNQFNLDIASKEKVKKIKHTLYTE